VIFINENGEIATKKDLVDGASPAPHGVRNKLVAVSAFTDVASVRVGAQHVTAKYRSTEVWLLERDGWRMISSQTLALQDDPRAISLPTGELDEYIGTYRAAPGYAVVIAREGARLGASLNGAPPLPLKVEARDVLFVPGQPRVRRIFKRDPSGVVIGFVSRREGHDIVFRRV
jgi:hypothetical protein